MFGQIRRVSSPHQRTEFITTYVRKWVAYISISRLHSTINVLIMQHFTYKRHNTFKTHLQYSKNCWDFLLFKKSQFTKNVLNVLQLNQYTHTWTHLTMDFCILSKAPGRCEWFDRHKKGVGEGYLHFELEPNTLEF